MSKVSQKEILEGIRTEIVAGSVLLPKSDADRAWNSANQRAKDIINMYIEGHGLFQLVSKSKIQRKRKREGK